MELAPIPNRTPIDYDLAWRAQKSLVDMRKRGSIPDLLWLLEHPPTITLGSAGNFANFLEPPARLERQGFRILKVDRGGDVTCHEPGQLVGYPIISLDSSKDRDLHWYLRSLEAGLIRYLCGLGIHADRFPGRTGVWVQGSPPRKIAAIGVGARRWITFHGFALNVENSLRGFETIVPCGIRDAVVTSVARELQGLVPEWGKVVSDVHRALEEALSRPLELVVSTQGLERAGFQISTGRPEASQSA